MNDDTLLYRQVSPSWLVNGEFTSQTFLPTRKDNGLLSVYDGDRITAEDSWRHFVGTLGHPSAGVAAVSVAECNDQQLPVRPDPEAFPEHVLIDFTGLSNSQKERKAAALKAAALARGWQFRPPLEV